jgi:hypothetical protein
VRSVLDCAAIDSTHIKTNGREQWTDTSQQGPRPFQNAGDGGSKSSGSHVSSWRAGVRTVGRLPGGKPAIFVVLGR